MYFFQKGGNFLVRPLDIFLGLLEQAFLKGNKSNNRKDTFSR